MLLDTQKHVSRNLTLVFRATRLLFSALLLGVAAEASVIYDFSGTVSFFGIAESFRYTAPNYITADTFVPASSFERCSTGQTQPCFGAMFFVLGPDSVQHYPELTFQIRNADNSVGTVFYYFPVGNSFASNGTLSTILANPGTLTISAAPEPATGLILLVGAFIFVRWGRNNRTGMPES